MKKPITERSSNTWKTLSAAVVARPATDIARNDAIDSAIQKAALGIEGAGAMGAMSQAGTFIATASRRIRLGQRRRVCKKTVVLRAEPAAAAGVESKYLPASLEAL